MSTDGVKSPQGGEVLSPAIPIRVQTMLFATAALVLAGALTVFASAYAVNRMKDLLVAEAREEVRLGALQACEQIRRVVADLKGANLAEVAQHPEVRRQLQLISEEQKGVVAAAITDTQGQVLSSHICDKEVGRGSAPEVLRGATRDPQGIESSVWELLARPSDRILAIDVPIMQGENVIGLLQVGLSRQLALGRIESLSQQISSSLLVMVLIVFAILLLTVVLVYYAFLRQMQLLHRTSSAEHLAEVGALASGLAHEIRNPLHAMNLHLSVAREDLEDLPGPPAETIAVLDRVQGQIERLNGIVTNFLSLSLPERLNRAEVWMDQVVKDVLTLQRPVLEAAGVSLELDVPEATYRVLGDRAALSQVLLNIIINATQIMEKRPMKVIRISGDSDRRSVRLLVEDSGPGVAPGDEEAIFKPFVTKRAGGTGFGLSIARRIMAAHGGKVYVTRSDRFGGACFVLEIPRVGGADVPRQERSGAAIKGIA